MDEACILIGRRVENNLNNGKPAFEGMGNVMKLAQGYRSVKSMARTNVKIKIDGTW